LESLLTFLAPGIQPNFILCNGLYGKSGFLTSQNPVLQPQEILKIEFICLMLVNASYAMGKLIRAFPQGWKRSKLSLQWDDA
jgi:hypothetical protein